MGDRAAALLAATLLACGGRAPQPVHPNEQTLPDAGVGSIPDAGAPDAGAPDAGVPDGGVSQAPDAGLPRLGVPESGTLYHGVLPASTTPQPDGNVSIDALDGYVRAAGREVAWVYFDNEWKDSRTFPVHTATWIRDRGSVPFIRLMLRTRKGELVVEPVFSLDRIIAGDFDGDLSSWADAARAFGTPLVVEYGTEVNGDWNPWSAPYNGGLDKGPPLFQRAYRHIVELMRARGASNITWALHYNGENFPGDDPRNVPYVYYPGDDVVDWVGISTYGAERSNDHRCPSLRSLVDAMVPQLRAATASKPLFLFELGITNNNPGCPAGPWLQAAFDDLLGGRWPDLRGFSWWQQAWIDDPSVGGVTDLLVQDDPSMTAAFRAALTGPRAAKIVDRPLLRR